MKKFFLFFVLLSSQVISQSGDSLLFNISLLKQRLTLFEQKTPLNYIYQPISIITKTDSILNGLFVGVMDDSLFYLHNSSIKSIKNINLSKLSISRTSIKDVEGWKGFFAGLHGSIVLMTFVIDKYEKRNPTFWELLIPCFVSSLLTGTITASINEDDPEMYNIDFNESNWLEFKKIISGKPKTRKFHFSILSSKIINDFTNLLKEHRNVNSEDNSIRFYSNGKSNKIFVKDIKFFRKVELAYTINNLLDFSLSLCNSGYPNSINQYFYNDTTRIVIFENDGISIFGTGIFKPCEEFLPYWLKWNIGAGVGLTWNDFKMNSLTNNDYSYKSNKFFQNEKIQLSCLFYNEIALSFDNSLSFGFVTDYIWLPNNLEIPSIPEVGFSAKSFNLGSFSYGINIGYHF